tara:strand:+ start:183 stop:791 length:609 start_codon:yes stop_codon:yes gene_type:complete
MKNNLILIGICVLIVIILVVAIILLQKLKKRRKNTNNAFDITQLTTLTLAEPHPSLKNQYSFDFRVFYSGSSKKRHVLMDRVSPVFKIDMSTGSIILKYSRMPLTTTEINQCGTTSEQETTEIDRKYEMMIETPSIPFQSMNKLIIKQDLRSIDVFLNGEQLHSAVLEYVPYLDPSEVNLLPYGAHKSIEIKKFAYNEYANF